MIGVMSFILIIAEMTPDIEKSMSVFLTYRKQNSHGLESI